jgi:Bacterial-like globin
MCEACSIADAVSRRKMRVPDSSSLVRGGRLVPDSNRSERTLGGIIERTRLFLHVLKRTGPSGTWLCDLASVRRGTIVFPKGGIMSRNLSAFLVISALVLASSTGFAQTAQKPLYDRLGGQKAIVAVVDDFVARVAADKRINSFFAKTAADPKQLAAFKQKLVDQICEASGGPCKYKGGI